MNNNDNERQARQILSEEEYTCTLQKIITRDYFPSIPSLHRDAAVLQKRSEGDTAGAIAIRRAARKIESQEERQNIQEQSEEKEAILNGGGIRKRPRPLDRESIDGFHYRVTSEDNAYFEERLEEEIKEKNKRLEIIYLANFGNCDGAVEKAKNSVQNLLLNSPFVTSASEQFDAPVERIQAAGTTEDGQSKTNRNSFFFTPQHYSHHNHRDDARMAVTQSTIPKESRTILQISSNNQDAKIDNQMMPPPPSRTSHTTTHNTITLLSNDINEYNIIQKRRQKQQQLIEYQAKNRNREVVCSLPTTDKQIIPQNTRFEYQNQSRIVPSSNLSSTSISCTNATLSNKRRMSYGTDSSMSTDLDAPLRPLDVERQARIKQLQNDRNTLVAMTPTIIPGSKERGNQKNKVCKGDDDDDDDDDNESVNDSPIVTWGTIASTPLVTGGEKLSQTQHLNMDNSSFNDIYVGHNGAAANNNERSFSLPSVDRREEAARKVEAKLAHQKQRFQEAGETPKRRKSSTTPALKLRESLTPAARSLLDRSSSSSSSTLKSNPKGSINICARSNSAFGSALKASYTPKRQSSQKTRSDNSKKNEASFHKLTPLVSGGIGSNYTISATESKGTMAKNQSLTSGLLKF